jgi:PadR family transcriptional regulator AphA
MAESLSITEYTVLGLLAEHPAHGFAISKELEPSGPIGRILTVRRPLVYRALDRLVAAGMAEAVHTEPGIAGPQRTVHRVTRMGRSRLARWLGSPAEHVRDLRIEFQLKLALTLRAGRSPLALVRAQRAVLAPTLTGLDQRVGAEIDHLELWRQHSAAAAAGYLEELERRYSGEAAG